MVKSKKFYAGVLFVSLVGIAGQVKAMDEEGLMYPPFLGGQFMKEYEGAQERYIETWGEKQNWSKRHDERWDQLREKIDDYVAKESPSRDETGAWADRLINNDANFIEIGNNLKGAEAEEDKAEEEMEDCRRKVEAPFLISLIKSIFGLPSIDPVVSNWF